MRRTVWASFIGLSKVDVPDLDFCREPSRIRGAYENKSVVAHIYACV